MAKRKGQKAPQRKVKKRAKKRRATAARRNASREVMNRPVVLSAELAEVVGAKALSRPEAVKKLWAYCKEKNLLNPADKREILCDDRLRRLLGKKTATMFGLQGLLAPHFDFSADVNVAEDEEEEEEDEGSAGEDGDEDDIQSATVPDLQALAQKLAPRVVRLEREAVTLHFTAYTMQCHFMAVATPLDKADGSALVRASCCVQQCKDEDGNLQTCGECRLEGLRIDCGYIVVIEVRSLGTSSSTQTFNSPGIKVPQRAHPQKWTPWEVQQWCMSLHVPNLAQKVKEYGVDGCALLSFTEEDLRGLGISTPFVLRRVLSALKGLGGG